jgi:alkylation response protein AidB-like acyl-CoA dehydrogenase
MQGLGGYPIVLGGTPEQKNKYYATEMAGRVVDMAVQIHGGMGVTNGTAVERLFREARTPRVYEGTTEIQKMVIANTLLRQAREREDKKQL